MVSAHDRIMGTHRLPEELAEETLLVTPAAFERLRLVGARTSAVVHGQISGRLAVLTPDLRDAVLRPDSRFFTVIDASALRPTAEQVELLDRSIIGNRRQLERLVIDYIAHYNTHRPHRSLDQRPPRHTTPDNNTTDHPLPLRLVRTTRCDGLINEYKHAA